MVYTVRFFSSKCSLFHNSNIFGSCSIHILYTGCAKIKKKLFRCQKVNVNVKLLTKLINSAFVGECVNYVDFKMHGATIKQTKAHL